MGFRGVVNSIVISFVLTSSAAFSAASNNEEGVYAVRWTGTEDRDASLSHIIAQINARTGLTLAPEDFRLDEDRPLAFNHYRRYAQIVANVPIRSMTLRVWTDTRSGELIQLDAQVEDSDALDAESREIEGLESVEDLLALSSEKTNALARRAIQQQRSTDRKLRAMSSEDVWQDSRLVRIVTVKAQRGTYTVTLDLQSQVVISTSYREYPREDVANSLAGLNARGEFSVPAMVYPFYEEYKGVRLPRRAARLKYLQGTRPEPADGQDPFAGLHDRRYLLSKHDPVQAETPEGQAAGYWSMEQLNQRVKDLTAQIPLAPNTLTTQGGALLRGRYVTVAIHPAAFDAFPGITIPKRYSSDVLFDWLYDAPTDDYEIIPRTSLAGKPLLSARDAWDRPVARPPQHDPALYINNGFDEVQVYYAVNELFEVLRPMGFVDPDLGERPFHAYLFNPDIESMDNAYYDSDTINFSTYSPNELNMARDNTTIWHELGHGVMDRLMGTKLDLADTGGLSEGMADFVAEMVLQGAAFEQDFPGRLDQRIINQTGFYLTNEVHDDGESYGGTMKSLLDAAIAREGRVGLKKTVDLVLEAMRLSRDHPALTADIWFERLYFADQLGRRGVRRAGEMHGLIEAALASRNFANETERAKFSLSYNNQEILAGRDGSRGHEIGVTLPADGSAEYAVQVQIEDGLNYKFEYPLSVKVFFESGPLQGAIDWEGEDTEPMVYQIAASGDRVSLPLRIKGQCDAVNRTDGSCSDFAYVQIWNANGTTAVAKKRFYLNLKTQQ